jgi:hypothetical protein
MPTLFECWNGGSAFVNGNTPNFVFNYPANNQELLAFFQLSGRIWEVLAGVDSYIVMGGQVFDVPNFPAHEVNEFVSRMQQNMGYTPMPLQMQALNNFGGFTSMGVVVWVNLGTGRADMYNPFAGYVYGMQLLQPQNNFQAGFYNQFNISLNTNGIVQGGGQKSTLNKIAGTLKDVNVILREGSQIYEFLDQQFDFGSGWSNDW